MIYPKHSILLITKFNWKSYSIMVSGGGFNWFVSYLSNRHQFVQFNDTSSSLHIIKCGIRSSPFPDLYKRFIRCYKDFIDFILFADDFNIIFSHKNVDSLEKLLNEELLKLTIRSQTNKLSKNYLKSEFMSVYFFI